MPSKARFVAHALPDAPLEPQQWATVHAALKDALEVQDAHLPVGAAPVHVGAQH